MAADELMHLFRLAVHARIVDRVGSAAPSWLLDQSLPHVADADAQVARACTGMARPGPLALLDVEDARLVTAIGLIEHDVRYGALFATLQEPLRSRRPRIGLLGWLLGDPCADARVHALAARGVVHIANEDDPRSEWVPRLPVSVWDVLRRGRIAPSSLPPGFAFRSGADFPDLAAVVLTGEIAGVAAAMPELFLRDDISSVVLRGMAGSGRRTLLGSIARALDRGLLVHDGLPSATGWPLLGTLAELGGALPAIVVAPGPGEILTVDRPAALARPLGVVIGRAGGLTGAGMDSAVSYSFGPCGAAERRAMWRSTATLDIADEDEIVTSLLLAPGAIARVARLAHVSASVEHRTWIGTADVRAATRAVQRQRLETLAARLDPLRDSRGPVLGDVAADEFDLLLARCRQREALSHYGGATANRGVRALFTGPSGTGKTLAARHLGGRLGLDVYRVDLATVVNKYIGETERNLEEVLSRAEELDVVLLLDEGDSLMTKRTDVGNAIDRYANLQTNFLLQRLESFDGIAIITTNAGGRIDPAFLRRIDATIEFVPPDAQQRLELWVMHLPREHDVSGELLTDIARRCELTGGQIRNATVTANLLALERCALVGDDDLLSALAREYRRAGASFPMRAVSAGVDGTRR